MGNPAPTPLPAPQAQPRTCQVGGTVCVALSVRVALFDGSGAVTESGGKDGRTVLYQGGADGSVVA